MSTEHNTNATKRCTVCKKEFPATTEFFNRQITYKDGLQSWCKACKSAYGQEYRSRPETKKHMQEYRSRPEIREQQIAYRKWYYQQPENYKHDRDRNRAYNKEYYKNPEKAAMISANGRNRRSREKKVLGTHTAKQIQEQLKRQKYRCYYAACGFAKFDRRNGEYVFHIDHTFPISRVAGSDIPANDISYLVLACPSCNMSKRNKFPWEWPEGGRLL